MTVMPESTISLETRFSDIIVPTIDNVRSSYLIEMLLIAKHPVLCIGPTGTGKSVSIMKKLSRNMPKEYITELMIFSAKTSAKQTQDLIDGKLDKRRKQVFGPPLGRFIVFFIDDLNMPSLEVYGAQPPIELIRQWMDFGGWYDHKLIGEFRHLIDVNFIAAMGPPGGGRNHVTPRLMRHFNFIAYNELDESSLKTIFGTIVKSWITNSSDDKSQNDNSIAQHLDKVVQSSIEVYLSIQSQLLPTPSKSHYTFNLRDLSKVFQGILMVNPIDLAHGLPDLLKLWYHESSRVFQDRLVNDEDRIWFRNLLNEKSQSIFQMSVDDYVKNEPLLYGDFILTSGIKKYTELTDYTKVSVYFFNLRLHLL